VKSDRWSDYPDGVLLKLVTLGYLIPESKVAKYYLFQERLEQLEQDTKRDLFQVIKSKMIELPDVDPRTAKGIVKEFIETYRDHPYRLKNGRCENLYAAQSIEKLQEGDPLQVDFHDFPLKAKFCRRTRPDTLYEQNGLLLYQWFMGASLSIRRGESYDLPPTDIIEDDPIIIREISEGGSDIFVIATDDLKLYRLAMNKFPDTWVFRMSCVHYLQVNTFCKDNELDVDEEMTRAFREEYGGHLEAKIIVDKGSVESWTHKYQESSGTYFQTIGIPWRKDIKKENLERKPMHGFIIQPQSKTMHDLRFPRSLYDMRTHELLKQSIRTSHTR
jgi:hypothetical protein